jgi:hypothetical protein
MLRSSASRSAIEQIRAKTLGPDTQFRISLGVNDIHRVEGDKLFVVSLYEFNRKVLPSNPMGS